MKELLEQINKLKEKISTAQVEYSDLRMKRPENLDDVAYKNAKETKLNEWESYREELDEIQKEYNLRSKEFINPTITVSNSQDVTVAAKEAQIENGLKQYFMLQDPNALAEVYGLAKDLYHVYDSQSQQNPSSVGRLVSPIKFVDQIIEKVRNETHILRLATVIPINDYSDIIQPFDSTDFTAADFVVENQTPTADNFSLDTRKSEIRDLAKKVTYSKRIESWNSARTLIQVKLSRAFSEGVENFSMTGSGINRPLGIRTAHADGIPTSQDVTMAGAEITYEDLVNMLTSLKSAYTNRGVWMFSRDALNDIMQMVDTAGNLIWNPTGNLDRAVTGNPGTILGRPYVINDYMTTKSSGSWASGAYSAIFGDFSYYWIHQMQSISTQLLVELHADNNRNGIIMRQGYDASPVIGEAFARLKKS